MDDQDWYFDVYLDGKVTPFRVLGGPIDNPKPARKAFQAIGYMSCALARLETHIDLLLYHLNKKEFGKQLFDLKHPLQFTDKVKMLRRYFQQHPNLAAHRKEVEKLTDELPDAAHLRNIPLHAIFDHYDVNTDQVTLTSIRPERPVKLRRVAHGQTKVQVKSINELTAGINAINRRLVEVSIKVLPRASA
jgi:hypothetical protein